MIPVASIVWPSPAKIGGAVRYYQLGPLQENGPRPATPGIQKGDPAGLSRRFQHQALVCLTRDGEILLISLVVSHRTVGSLDVSDDGLKPKRIGKPLLG